MKRKGTIAECTFSLQNWKKKNLKETSWKSCLLARETVFKRNEKAGSSICWCFGYEEEAPWVNASKEQQLEDVCKFALEAPTEASKRSRSGSRRKDFNWSGCWKSERTRASKTSWKFPSPECDWKIFACYCEDSWAQTTDWSWSNSLSSHHHHHEHLFMYETSSAISFLQKQTSPKCTSATINPEIDFIGGKGSFIGFVTLAH